MENRSISATVSHDSYMEIRYCLTLLKTDCLTRWTLNQIQFDSTWFQYSFIYSRLPWYPWTRFPQFQLSAFTNSHVMLTTRLFFFCLPSCHCLLCCHVSLLRSVSWRDSTCSPPNCFLFLTACQHLLALLLQTDSFLHLLVNACQLTSANKQAQRGSHSEGRC